MMNTKTPHAANPVGKASPHQTCVCECLHVRENTCAGRGKTGDRLKQGVHIRWDLTSDHKRNGTENT